MNDGTLESLRGQISYVFQETQTVNESILDNIRLGKPDATPEEVERAARMAGIPIVYPPRPSPIRWCSSTRDAFWRRAPMPS